MFKNISLDLVQSGRICPANLGVQSCLVRKLICPDRLSPSIQLQRQLSTSTIVYPFICLFWKAFIKAGQEIISYKIQQTKPLKLQHYETLLTHSETELNFDDSFPWEDAVALQKYDTAFKSGAAFGWEKKKKEIEEQAKIKEQQYV